MRAQTRNFVSTLGLGILGVSYMAGAQAASTNLTISTVAANPTATATASPTPTASAKPTAAKKKTTTKKTTSSGTTTKKKTSTSSGASGTKSASVDYRVEGDNNVVKLAVTMKSGKITDIDYSGSTATEGRYAVFPDLVQAAKSANGSSFGNISGATYTTKAFKSALSAALGKF